MLSILWLFEIVFLDDFYKSIKISQVKVAAQSIAQNIDNESLISLMQRFATENQMCISIIDEKGKTYLYADVLPDCVIHRTDSFSISNIYADARANSGSSLKYIDRSAFINSNYDENNFFGEVPGKDPGMRSIIIYTKIAHNSSMDRNYAVVVNSTVSPIGSTVSTLRTLLLYVTGIMAVVAIMFSAFISSSISKPISEMTQAAKSLAQGDYEHKFTGGQYKETTELASALNYASGELKKVDTLKSELIANVSHDLRTPLTMIKGYSEMMLDFPDEYNSENLQVIIDETTHLAGLVSDMLDLSKLQAGAMEVNKSRFSITQCISSIAARQSAMISKDGYEITFEYEDEVFVNADEMKISQVIYNLINNAINYAGEDKLVHIRQIDKGEFVRIEIIDHGSGIDKDKLDDIWDRYYKIDSTHKRTVVGSGLGLSIVKNILKLHSADFGVDSEVGMGSTFYFELEKSQDI